jgi:hypothetical protein
MGVGGIRYQRNLNSATTLAISLYSTYEGMNSDRIRVIRDSTNDEITGYEQVYFNRFNQHKLGLTMRINKRINSQNNLRVGLITEKLNYRFIDTLNGRSISGVQDATSILRCFVQWRHRFSNSLSISTGAHGLFFLLNNSWSVDPRMALSWQFTPRSSLHFGAGIHSQLQPMYLYFQQDLSGQSFNKDLQMSQSQHYVVNYTNAITPHIRMRVETFFQNLTGIPVEVDASSWSMLNQGLDFKLAFPGQLKNTGTGQNYGVEFSLERIFLKGYYYLISATLHDSRYAGSDEVRRNTDYNGRYIFNVVGGKEWSIGKSRTLGVGLRSTLDGGRRYSPIDIDASRIAGETVIVDSLAYSKQFRDYFRTDFRITFRIETQNSSHEIGLDLLNVIPLDLGRNEGDLPDNCTFLPLSTRNVHSTNYNPVTDGIATEFQLGFLPIIYYRVKI